MRKIENIYLEVKEDGFNVVILYNGEQVVIASYTGKEKALYPEPAIQEGNVVIALKWTQKKAPCPGTYHGDYVDKNGLPNTYCGMCGEGLPPGNGGAGYRPCW